jgi:hypothetical protein
MTNPCELLENEVYKYMQANEAYEVLQLIGDWPEACDAAVNSLWLHGKLVNMAEFGL